MPWSDLINATNPDFLAAFGEPITYLPQQGLGTPIATSCILLKHRITQSSAPGYFADVEVDPGLNPHRKDIVTWADGTDYVVAQVINPPYGLVTLALHLKTDPTS